MQINKKLNGWIATKAIGLAGKIEHKRLIKSCRYPQDTAEKTLRGILEYARDTEFGRKYGFADILAARTGMNSMPVGERMYRRRIMNSSVR